MRAPDAADQIIGIYRRHARAWAAARRAAPVLEAGWLAQFAGLLSPSGNVLDIGCGPGVPMAQYLLRRGFSVLGVDSAPEMIAMFRANLPEAKAEQCDMRLLALERQFSGILAWDSFFHLRADDQRGMFPVFRRHAAPGSALMFTSGPAAGVAIGELEGEPLHHASLDAEEYRDLLDRHGFDVARHIAEDAEAGGRTVWLARQRGG